MPDLTVTNPQCDIEKKLLKLCEYGKPRLTSFGNGAWYCGMEMFVTGKGIQFEIKSDYDHPSISQAVLCCEKRLKEALEKLGLTYA